MQKQLIDPCLDFTFGSSEVFDLEVSVDPIKNTDAKIYADKMMLICEEFNLYDKSIYQTLMSIHPNQRKYFLSHPDKIKDLLQ